MKIKISYLLIAVFLLFKVSGIQQSLHYEHHKLEHTSTKDCQECYIILQAQLQIYDSNSEYSYLNVIKIKTENIISNDYDISFVYNTYLSLFNNRPPPILA